MKPTRLLLPFILLLNVLQSHAQLIPDPTLAPFIHGVASGDALSDRVIIWTRITSTDSMVFTVNWKVATDTLMTDVVQSGISVTDSSVDFTVKVDVTGLQQDTWYYYQFEHNGRKSLTGRTKTLPDGDNSRVRFAIASCARLGGGDYYNAYLDIARRNDIQAVVFLGDYIYEGNGGVSGLGVQVLPTHETVTLEDYRLRYNTYRLDPDLQRAHQQYPFYNVWDDHETANDSWVGGAEGHNDTTQGNWFTRKEAGQRAFFEWLPIRPKAAGSYSIYRSFSIGNLVDLIMIDTRLEGRHKQAAALDQTAYADTNRSILGTPQMQWLKTELSNSDAKWRIIGNQVMFARLRIGTIAFSYDQWDGYLADRNRIINHVLNNGINNVAVITGDIHTSWANDIPQEGVTYNPNTGAGSAFVEFVGPSISTGSPVDNNLLGFITPANPHMKYIDLIQSGYAIIDVDTDRLQGDWYHVSTLQDRNFTVTNAASWYVNDNERFLREASAEAPAFSNNAAFAPLNSGNFPLGVAMHGNTLTQFNVYPNPFDETLVVTFHTEDAQAMHISITDLSGKELLRADVKAASTGIQNIQLNTTDLGSGMLLVRMYVGNILQAAAKVMKR